MSFMPAITAGQFMAGAAAAIVGGTAISIVGQRREYKAEKAIARYNAQVYQREAAQERRALLEEQLAKRKELQRVLSYQKAQYAQAGVSTPIDVQLDTISEYSGEIARLTMSHDISMRQSLSRAGTELYHAKTGVAAGRVGVSGALIGGVGGLATLGYSYKLRRESS